MKTRILSTVLFTCVAFSMSAQSSKVKLSDDSKVRKVEVVGDIGADHIHYCDIILTKEKTDDDGNTTVNVEIDNNSETFMILLFGHNYSEKELKKLFPKIYYDKTFPGDRGYRELNVYPGLEKSYMCMDVNQKYKLTKMTVQEGKTGKLELPLYFAKYKKKSLFGGLFGGSNGRNKLNILEQKTIEIEIEVEVKPDEDFIRLENECNKLIKEISTQSFCNNPKHKPNLETQEAPYKERIRKMISEIDGIIQSRQIPFSSNAFNRYDELKKKLKSLDFSKYERDCGKKHTTSSRGPGGGRTTPPIHQCKFCGLTPDQALGKMNNYYYQIYNSSNRAATKRAVMADVNILYNCPSWKNSNKSGKIRGMYGKITSF